MLLFLMLAAFQGTAASPAQEAAPPAPERQALTADELLQKLANPLASLATLGLSVDFDYHMGPAEGGHRETGKLLATLPLSLGDTWNILSRTVLPVIYQEEIFPGADTQFGLGDLTQAVYIVGVQPGRRGWLGGAGALLRVPLSSDDLLSSRKWSLGPSFALVRQQDDVTIGLIGGHLWSVAGDDTRSNISLTTLEAFSTWRTGDLWNLTLRVPAAFDTRENQWTVPIYLSVEKLSRLLSRPTTITFGLHYWAEGPDGAPHDFGFQFGLTLVFQKE